MSLLKKIITLSFFGIIAVSCQILNSNIITNERADNGQLGAIAKFSNSGLLSGKFEEVGAFKLTKPIKVKVNEVSSASSHQVKRVDSANHNSKDKTVSLELQIIDEINFLTNLNAIENSNYLDYLKENKDTFIRKSGVWIFSTEHAATLLNARSVYLINDGLSSYALNVLTEDKKEKKIDFENPLIYRADYIQTCWKKNNRGELYVAALKDKGQKCPGTTKQKLEDLEKEDLFDKIK